MFNKGSAMIHIVIIYIIRITAINKKCTEYTVICQNVANAICCPLCAIPLFFKTKSSRLFFFNYKSPLLPKKKKKKKSHSSGKWYSATLRCATMLVGNHLYVATSNSTMDVFIKRSSVSFLSLWKAGKVSHVCGSSDIQSRLQLETKPPASHHHTYRPVQGEKKKKRSFSAGQWLC